MSLIVTGSVLRLSLFTALIFTVVACATSARAPTNHSPSLPAINSAMKDFTDQQEIAGAVTMVISQDHIIHLGATGFADLATRRPMTSDALFWIASMTKPITATAIMMLQDQGKLSVDDPVEKYIPAFANISTADGTPGNVTLKHLLTHTSGLSESTKEERNAAKSLAALIPGVASRPLQFPPGSRWTYCQSGMNTLGRIIEVVSGESFPAFLQNHILGPLGMIDTTFYPTPAQLARLVTAYKQDDGKLIATPLPWDFDPANVVRFPAANGGLFSTTSDYARFCSMLLNDGTYGGRTFLSKSAVEHMRSVASGELKTGFIDGNAWGLGVCVVREALGVSAALSPGSFGHGGAYGTEAWIDPIRKIAYILMISRSNFPNADNSDVRKRFQDVAAELNPAVKQTRAPE
jgi:CubicO group peptidase (beta-lactamase class C family)